MGLAGTAVVSLSSAIVGGAVATYLTAIRHRQRRIRTEICDSMLTEVEPVINEEINLATKFDKPKSEWESIPTGLKMSLNENTVKIINDYAEQWEDLASKTNEVCNREEQVINSLSNARMTDGGAEFVIDFDSPYGPLGKPGPVHEWAPLREFLLEVSPVIKESNEVDDLYDSMRSEHGIDAEFLNHSAGGWTKDLRKTKSNPIVMEYLAAVHSQELIYRDLINIAEDVNQKLVIENRRIIGITRRFSGQCSVKLVREASRS